MRSATIVANKKLHVLPHEQICEQINGVWNLSSDQVLMSFLMVYLMVQMQPQFDYLIPKSMHFYTSCQTYCCEFHFLE